MENLDLSRVRDAELFRGLSPDEVRLVLSQATVGEYARKSFVFRQAAPAKDMFLLQSGRVRLQEITPDGRELLIRFVKPGEVFGDKAAIAESEYGAMAVSDTAVRAYSWTTTDTVRLLQQIPQLSTNLFAIAAEYLHYARERYRLLATGSAETRIAWAVAQLARNFGVPQANTTAITGRALQSDIADLAFTTIYTVSRVLRRYHQGGLLNVERGRIVLLPGFQSGT